MKVLIIDTTHGGDVLAMEYASMDNEVTCVDCYGTSRSEVREELVAKGIRWLSSPPEEDFDLLLMPVHCPDDFISGARFEARRTFHQAVGELASFKGLTFEVTGVKGKTSTCHVISHMMNRLGRKVLQLTSRGIHLYGEEEETLEERSSIAPTSILRISRMETEFDNGVFEVSLGGTGLADVAIITTIGDNYPIAAGTRTAFDAKKQMLNMARKVAVVPEEERELWTPQVPPGVWLTTFGEEGIVDAYIDGPHELGEEVEVKFRVKPGGEFSTRFSGEFLVPAYLRPFSAAISALKSLGIPPPQLCEVLSDFNGVPGRGEVLQERDTWIVRDRNPGVSVHSVEYLLGILEEYYEAKDIGLVIEPVSIRVCEKLDLTELGTINEVHDSVTGAYLLDHSGKEVEGFRNIQDLSEILDDHGILLHCTKEGYL